MGAVILETSKLHMHEFWYDHLKNKYNDKVELIYTDTDSFIIKFKQTIYIKICIDISFYITSLFLSLIVEEDIDKKLNS